MGFGPEVLEALDASEEVEIETPRPDGRRPRTVIWVVVDRSDVFVRSVRGERGVWWRAAVEQPEEVALIVGDRRHRVRAVPATDDESIARCSAALASKYASDPSTRSMLRRRVLSTTLRLEPL